jgi:hypothetical protein
MNYETEIIDGNTKVVRNILKPNEIKVGSRWIRADGSNQIVTVEDVIKYDSRSLIVYSWVLENQEPEIGEKDLFSFQCRYCLILE